MSFLRAIPRQIVRAQKPKFAPPPMFQSPSQLTRLYNLKGNGFWFGFYTFHRNYMAFLICFYGIFLAQVVPKWLNRAGVLDEKQGIIMNGRSPNEALHAARNA